MKLRYISVIGSLVLIAANNTAVAQDEAIIIADPVPQEYVRVCDTYGVGYYYLPSTEICVNADTGEARMETDEGTLVEETELAKRVTRLEETLRRIVQIE